MDNMVEVIRKIVESEVRKLRIAELGEVTSIFPHSSDSDKDNYECNVKLKYQDFELRKVPVATQHIGLANTPNVGDLVLVTFVNGDINAPVITGRLYTDEDRPPVNKEEEIVYIPPYSKGSGLRRLHMEFPNGIVLSVTDDEVTAKAGKTTFTLNHDGDVAIDSNANVTAKAGRATLTLKRDGDVIIESGAKINVKATGDLSFEALNVKIASKANVEIKAGAMAKFEATGPLNIKGTPTDIEGKPALNITGIPTVNINKGALEVM
jgi:phage baseplate assembly protein gpV